MSGKEEVVKITEQAEEEVKEDVQEGLGGVVVWCSVVGVVRCGVVWLCGAVWLCGVVWLVWCGVVVWCSVVGVVRCGCVV